MTSCDLPVTQCRDHVIHMYTNTVLVAAMSSVYYYHLTAFAMFPAICDPRKRVRKSDQEICANPGHMVVGSLET